MELKSVSFGRVIELVNKETKRVLEDKKFRMYVKHALCKFDLPADILISVSVSDLGIYAIDDNKIHAECSVSLKNKRDKRTTYSGFLKLNLTLIWNKDKDCFNFDEADISNKENPDDEYMTVTKYDLENCQESVKYTYKLDNCLVYLTTNTSDFKIEEDDKNVDEYMDCIKGRLVSIVDDNYDQYAMEAEIDDLLSESLPLEEEIDDDIFRETNPTSSLVIYNEIEDKATIYITITQEIDGPRDLSKVESRIESKNLLKKAI